MNFPRPITKHTVREDRYKIYFQALCRELKDNHGISIDWREKSSNAAVFNSTFDGFFYRISFARGNRVQVALEIRPTRTRHGHDTTQRRELSLKWFDSLKDHATRIESCFGRQLHWERTPAQIRQYVATYRPGPEDIWSSEGALEKIADWHIENLLKLREVFIPEVKAMLHQADVPIQNSTLTDDQLRGHDSQLNHVNDVLTTVLTEVRRAYPPDDHANLFVGKACDAIKGIQDLRNELWQLALGNPDLPPP